MKLEPDRKLMLALEMADGFLGRQAVNQCLWQWLERWQAEAERADGARRTEEWQAVSTVVQMLKVGGKG